MWPWRRDRGVSQRELAIENIEVRFVGVMPFGKFSTDDVVVDKADDQDVRVIFVHELPCAQVDLIDSIAEDASVDDRRSQFPLQPRWPRFAVGHLVAKCKGIAYRHNDGMCIGYRARRAVRAGPIG